MKSKRKPAIVLAAAMLTMASASVFATNGYFTHGTGTKNKGQAGAGGMDLSSCLGGANGAGFGWDDMTTYKVGVEWGQGSDWTWRAGYSNGDQPIPDSEVLFNILAPGVIEDHVSFGFTKKSGRDSELSLAVMYALDNDVSGTSPFDPTQTITLSMHQWEVELGYSWNF